MFVAEDYMRKVSKSNHGFTLLEIIVVIAIIAILAAVVFISAARYLNAGQDVKSNIDSLEQSFSEAKDDINQDYIDLGY